MQVWLEKSKQPADLRVESESIKFACARLPTPRKILYRTALPFADEAQSTTHTSMRLPIKCSIGEQFWC